MVNKQSRSEIRVKKHNRMRNRFAGTAERPRLAVFRSNNHMYAQIIDDTVGNTLVAASTVEKEITSTTSLLEPAFRKPMAGLPPSFGLSKWGVILER